MILNVNAHLHTPYSFSAFRDIDEALDRTVAENLERSQGSMISTPLKGMIYGPMAAENGNSIRCLVLSSSA